jgi:hypothetical protein
MRGEGLSTCLLLENPCLGIAEVLLSLVCRWRVDGVACRRGAERAALVAPRLLPVVPWFNAFEVLAPGPPPVPLIVLPLDSVVPPVAPPDAAPEAAPALDAPPAAPPALCANANEQLAINVQAINRTIFISKLPIAWSPIYKMRMRCFVPSVGST